MANLPGRDKAEPVAAYDFLDVAEAWFMVHDLDDRTSIGTANPCYCKPMFLRCRDIFIDCPC